MGQTHSARKQIGLFRRSGNPNSGHHNFQNCNQHHTFYKGRINDGDGNKNYYLRTPLPRYEYMRVLLSRFPEEIINKYNLLIYFSLLLGEGDGCSSSSGGGLVYALFGVCLISLSTSMSIFGVEITFP
jgi:hypothetical protein